jgi:thiamine-phosphate pyrophosphorylase
LKLACPRLFIVTSDEIAARPGFVGRLERVLAVGGGLCGVQLRAHGLAGGAAYDLASELRRLTQKHGAALWINDRVDVAIAVRADGVQLGARSADGVSAGRLLGRCCWIGRSVHSVEEVEAASADVYLLGNIYATASHPGRPPLGLRAVRAAVRGGRPIIGIGGITPERAGEVIEAGARGIAVLSGVWEADDAAVATTHYLSALGDAASVEL